uniref:Acetylcholine receptor subunit beta n=1 Tax=Anthurium amnicola TaxID=1678845 RepID=A0A1D1ZDE6_9ARAE
MAAIGRLTPPLCSLLGGTLRQPESHRHLLLAAAGPQPPSPHLRLKAPRAAINASTALHLAVASPASAGDLSVLIPVSTVLLIVYLIANFVVPEIISKDLHHAEPNEDIWETDSKVDETLAKPSKPSGQSNKLSGSKSSRR